jgi:hypothetical protein
MAVGKAHGGLAMLVRGIGKYRRALAIFLSTLIMSGCAIHPLPDDFAHVSTYNIVRQIRCETRKAVIDSILGYLTNEDNRRQIIQDGRFYQKVDDVSYAAGMRAKEAYEANPLSIMKFNVGALTGTARNVIGLLLHTGIAYNFDLTGLEKNNVNAEVNFLRPLPIMTLPSLNAKGNFDRSRQNERLFTITDNFQDLVKKTPPGYCVNSIVEANIVYPITGKVGMERAVHDFLLLTVFGNLSGDGKDVTKVAGPPTMVDQLEFVTTIGGSATPKVDFSPVGRTFQVADASFGLSALRQDTHKLTVGMFLDQAGAVEVTNVRTAVFGGLITWSGGNAERGAARAVEQFLQLKIFPRAIVFQP